MDQISQILNDPESMKQISELATILSPSGGDSNHAHSDFQIPNSLTNILLKAQEKDEKQQALVRALLPYLRPTHQKKLQRAIEIAKVSCLARAALSTELFSQNKEVADDL